LGIFVHLDLATLLSSQIIASFRYGRTWLPLRLGHVTGRWGWFVKITETLD